MALVAEAQAWITVIMNGLPWKRTEIILLFLRLHPTTAFESPLDCKEIQPVHPKGDQFWVFTGRTDVEAETPILWPRDAKSGLIGKDLEPGNY